MKSIWQQLPQPFFVLAPMEAVTDVVFRQVVAKAAAPDLYMTEFTNATGWVHAGMKAVGGRLHKEPHETHLVAQLWGGEPGDMEQLAAYCKEQGFAGIDINMGCPAKSAVKSGGSALIRNPELAKNSIIAAKTAGLPVSVKTRLGYTHVDEWRDWLGFLLRQDIANLTIHLRTKKEMSKVPAHHELIPEIIALRDELAPGTLLTINGDIADREHGLQLVHQFPGINGIMIGRGVFHNPYCFSPDQATPPVSLLRPARAPSDLPSSYARSDSQSESSQREGGTTLESIVEPLATQANVIPQSSSSATTSEEGKGVVQPRDFPTRVRENSGAKRPLKMSVGEQANVQNNLLDLLHHHLDLYDKYAAQTGRPYETLKRFYKIYIRDFEGAAELRDKLMHTHSTDEVRTLLATMPTAQPSNL